MNPNSYQPSKTPKIVGGVVLSAAVVAAVLFFFMNHGQASQTALDTTSPTTQSQSVDTSNSSSAASGAAASGSTSSSYKDGTYTASADYDVPHDTNTIKVTVAVKNGVISSVNEQDSYGDRESVRYISAFKSSISSYVVGKSLSEAQVARVSGASDTSDGFEQALQQIANQAKA